MIQVRRAEDEGVDLIADMHTKLGERIGDLRHRLRKLDDDGG